MSGIPLAWRLRAAATVAVVPPLVRFGSFGKLATRLGRTASTPARDAAGLDDASLARWVDRLLHLLRGPWCYTCLRRSAVLYRLLTRAGRPVELLIGVRRDADSRVAAHAWLARDGAPYLEPDPAIPAQLTVIARFPERAAPAA